MNLPDDVLAVWGGTPQDRETARLCIEGWGLETFRASAIHQAAIIEQGRVKQKRLEDRKGNAK